LRLKYFITGKPTALSMLQIFYFFMIANLLITYISSVIKNFRKVTNFNQFIDKTVRILHRYPPFTGQEIFRSILPLFCLLIFYLSSKYIEKRR
jgi:hypothetical protein